MTWPAFLAFFSAFTGILGYAIWLTKSIISNKHQKELAKAGITPAPLPTASNLILNQCNEELDKMRKELKDVEDKLRNTMAEASKTHREDMVRVYDKIEKLYDRLVEWMQQDKG